MKRKVCASAVLAISALGCDRVRDIGVQSSGTAQEEHVLRETVRFGGLLHEKARGELTDAPYRIAFGSWGCRTQGGCLASGWWVSPVAYYYRPHIVEYELGVVSDIAAHEVCHSKETLHNAKHLACIASVGARATYALIQGVPVNIIGGGFSCTNSLSR